MHTQKTPRSGRRLAEDEIIAVLKEAAAGAKPHDLCRRYKVSERAFYRWKIRFRGLLRMLGEFEDENRRLRRLVSDLALDNQALKELIGRGKGGEAHHLLDAPAIGVAAERPIDHRSHLSMTTTHRPGLREHRLVFHAPMEAAAGAN
jgi:putative transposase